MFIKYFEKGLSVIPVMKRGKAPIIPNWSKYCKELPNENEVEGWTVDRYNIGIACGPASGIIVLDIDTNDPNIISKCPMSPVVRVGAKGEARFFKYDPNIKSQSIPYIDILAEGRQVVVPPSIHPTTGKAYKWVSKDTLENFDIGDLPELDISFLNELKANSVAGIIETGRNNKLVDMVTSMRSRGEPETEIVQEVFDWDNTYHDPPLFTDEKEGNKGDGYKNAWLFVNRVSKTLISSGVASMESAGTVIAEDKVVAPLYKEESFPIPGGLMGDIMELISDESIRDLPHIALGGAISLMSIICSNRFRFNQTWPNTYILNLAPTGAGKSFPQKIIKLLLEERLNSGLMGYGSYKSSSAISKNLVSRRERLDVVDEISSLFAQMKKGGVYQMEIVDELCKLWSDSNSKYLAGEYAGKENTSTCYNPCISILGSTTFEGIKENIDKLMITKGLIPRFLIFSHEELTPQVDSFRCEKKINKVVSKIEKILDIEKRIAKVNVGVLHGPMYNPRNLAPTNKEALDYFKQINRELGSQVERKNLSNAMKSMYTRGTEHVMKLATKQAASMLGYRKIKDNGVIQKEDLEWAYKVFQVQLNNAKQFIEESDVSNEWEKDFTRAENLITKKGFITEGKLRSWLRLKPQKFQEVLTHLTKSSRIKAVSKKHGGNNTVVKGFSPFIV